MLFDQAGAQKGQTMFIHGGAGNVGGYAVQLTHCAGLRVIASAFDGDVEFVRARGACDVVDTRSTRLAEFAKCADAVIDTVGGASQEQLFAPAKPGGIIVSSVSQPNAELARQHGLRAVFFVVDVNGSDLARLPAREVVEISKATGRTRTDDLRFTKPLSLSSKHRTSKHLAISR